MESPDVAVHLHAMIEAGRRSWRDIANHYNELPLWSAPFGQLILEAVPMRRG